jgi:hypothetical protein
MESVPHYRQQPYATSKFGIHAYLNTRFEPLRQRAREEFQDEYLATELAKLERQCDDELKTFNCMYGSLVIQFEKAISQDQREAIIKLTKWVPDNDSSGIRGILQENAMGLFLSQLREKGYPFRMERKEEARANDCFGVMCSVHAYVITVTLV